MPGLLAAEGQAVGVERGQHVAVPHVGLAHRNAAGLHGQPKAEVGHDGDGHGVAGQVSPFGQVQREERQQHVAVDHGAVVVNGNDTVGVAVEGQPEVGLVRHDRARQLAGVGRAALVVDVRPIRRVVQRPHLGAESGQHLGGDGAGRTVGAVDDDMEAVEAAPLQRGDEVRLVELHGTGGVGTETAYAVAGRSSRWPVRVCEQRLELALYFALDLDGQLRPQQAEELDPVVAEGVVRGRNDGPGRLA